MFSLLIFLISISSFSVLAAFRFKKSFEHTIAVGCMGVMGILFLFGMFRALFVGTIVTLFISIDIYIYTLIYLIRAKDKNLVVDGLKKFFSVGFFVFSAVLVFLLYISEGRMALAPDEFSHWVDTVKIMANLNAFGTAPGSWATFPSYPPAMSLLQYYSQKIFELFSGSKEFVEWRCYFVYKLFAVAVMLPFLGFAEQRLKKQLINVISWLPVLLLPLIIFCDFYSSCYIDGLLSVLLGSGFAAVVVWKERDWLYTTYIGCVAATLVLAKDVGTLLAVFLVALYVIEYLDRKGIKEKHYISLAVPAVALIVAKLLWKLNLKIEGTHIRFNKPFQIKTMIDIICGRDNTYLTEVYIEYKSAMVRYVYYVGKFGFNYWSCLLCVILGLFITTRILYRRKTISKRLYIASTVVPGILFIFYTLGLCPLYISRFSEEEALQLASFDRYFGIIILSGILTVYFLLKYAIDYVENKYRTMLVCVTSFLVWQTWINKDNLRGLLSRESVLASQAIRSQYDVVVSKIEKIANPGDDIYMIIVEDDGTECARIRFALEPIALEGYDDITYLTGEENYLVLYRVNDEFVGNYQERFGGADKIVANGVYRINSDGTFGLIL